MDNKITKMVFTALFTALAIIIPIYFGFLKIIIGPFTATLASHVPIFLSMYLSPASAVVVAIGSTLGFLYGGLPIVVVFRAAMHIIVGFIGAVLVKKGFKYRNIVLITAPIHGILEGLAVIPFYGLNIYYIIVVTAVGSMLHHCADGFISGVLLKSLSKALRRDLTKGIIRNQQI
ncbi:ECF transporter S component [Clostridium frigidicarnis]|uniref:Niacin transporter n=1 Tax=Clostridium frigidicarnis TaxID=84698 RepID=A0A1I0WUL3_9CLOT|nr:ECF transporter S component [Clostridium frigidicarnis]SFA92311.1 niacin transporter [Clostridium frigidicarnis]